MNARIIKLLFMLMLMLSPMVAEAGSTYYYSRGKYAGRSYTRGGYTQYYGRTGRYSGSSRNSYTGRTNYYGRSGLYKGYTSRYSKIPSYGRK